MGIKRFAGIPSHCTVKKISAYPRIYFCSVCKQPIRETRPPIPGQTGIQAKKKWQRYAAGKVTVSLASRWLCVEDCGMSTKGFSGDEPAASTAVRSMYVSRWRHTPGATARQLTIANVAPVNTIFIDRVAGAIIRLVASVCMCVCVCPFVCGRSHV